MTTAVSISVFCWRNRLLREALTRILNEKNDIHVVRCAPTFSPGVVGAIQPGGPV